MYSFAPAWIAFTARARVIGNATGDDRHVDAFGVESCHQVTNVEGHVHHQQIGARDRSAIQRAPGVKA